MANRQSSAWAAAQQNDRPGAQRDDALPENTDDVRGRADDDDDFDEEEDDEAVDEDEEAEEGTF